MFKSSWMTQLGLTVLLFLGLALGIAVSLALLTVFLGVGLVISGWLWWKTRQLRRQARQNPEFIEAEYHVETTYPLLDDRRPPEEKI